METSESASSSRSRPRNSRLAFFSSFVLALAVLLLISGFYYKSFSATVEKETRVPVLLTGNFRNFVPHRPHRGDNMASTDQDQPSDWSHLLGTNAEEAKKKIQEQDPSLQVVVVRKDGLVTMDYKVRRVRIFKDENENVSRVPKRG